MASDGGTKISIAEQSQVRPMKSQPTLAGNRRPAEPGGLGRRLRPPEPRFEGLRDDKDAAEVVRETPAQ